VSFGCVVVCVVVVVVWGVGLIGYFFLFYRFREWFDWFFFLNFKFVIVGFVIGVGRFWGVGCVCY